MGLVSSLQSSDRRFNRRKDAAAAGKFEN